MNRVQLIPSRFRTFLIAISCSLSLGLTQLLSSDHCRLSPTVNLLKFEKCMKLYLCSPLHLCGHGASAQEQLYLYLEYAALYIPVGSRNYYFFFFLPEI
jgi:hypothetical protein